MEITLAYIVHHGEFFITIISLVGGYMYGKGQKNIQEAHTVAEMKELNDKFDELKKKFDLNDSEVKRIIEALERTYATMQYCHDTFTDTKTFDDKVDSLKDHISLSIEGLANVINVYMKMDKK